MKSAKRIAVLTLIIALLAGCSGRGKLEDRFTELRNSLLEAAEISFSADVSADLGLTVFNCSLDCRHCDGKTEVCVTKPDIIAGIKASISDDGTELEYDGLILDLGLTAQCSDSPVSVPGMICSALLNAHISELYTEKDENGESLLCVKLYRDENSYDILRLSADGSSPLSFETVTDGKAVLSCNIYNFVAQFDKK